MSVSLDDIMEPVEPKDTIQSQQPKNKGKKGSNMKTKIKKVEASIINEPAPINLEPVNQEASNPEPVNPEQANINMDNLLDSDVIKFDNKNQSSMYFIACKAVNYLNKELKDKYELAMPLELYNKIIKDVIPELIGEYTANLKKRCKKVIPEDMLCIGRKIDNKQCSRKRADGSDYCKSHLKRLSNGRMDQPIPVINKNKRGRKPKVQFDPRRYDNEYITLWEDIIEGEKVLIDTENNVYTFDTAAPVLIGKKDVNSTVDLKKLIEKYRKN